MKKLTLCPVCGEGHLCSKVIQVEREFENKKKMVDLHLSECNFCGAEIALDSDLKKNTRAINAFRKKCLGLLSGDEIRKIRKSLSINQKEAVAIFGSGKKDYSKFSKYENDDIIQSVSMDKLIRIAHEHNDIFIELCKEAGVIKSNMSLNIKKIKSKTKFISECDNRWMRIGTGSLTSITQ